VLAPSHVSTASQTPAEARQVVPIGCTSSAGQVALTPLHASATSQPPLAARQVVPAGRTLFAGQSSVEPVHVSATSQPPASALRQTVLAGSRVSAGQSGLEPVQDSARSQLPRCARHSRLEGARPSAGQLEAPPQVSATSHAPAAGRQTVAPGAGPVGTHRALGAHSQRPSSQTLPVEQGAPGTHALEQPPRPSHEPLGQLVPVAA